MRRRFTVGMVILGSLGDHGFHDSAFAGLKRVRAQLSARIVLRAVDRLEDVAPSLAALAEEGADLVWALGAGLAGATAQVAARFPATSFAIVDAVVARPNVASVVFKEQEGAFLMGLLAARATTRKVGFVGGGRLTRHLPVCGRLPGRGQGRRPRHRGAEHLCRLLC